MNIKSKIFDPTLKIMTALLVAVFAGTLLISCKKDTESATEINTKILSSHSWNLQSLKVDGVDQTSLYTSMVLSFAEGSYTTTKGLPVWAANGTWAFSTDDGLMITRDDKVLITIVEIGDEKLILNLIWNKTTYKAGRLNSIAGQHQFTFIK
jgi:hypothetical protein